MARLPPDGSTSKHDRSVWKGLVVQPDEFAPARKPRLWVLALLVLGTALAIAILIYRLG